MPYFITGTDTEVGKTWVSLGLMAGFQSRGVATVGMKPVAAGCECTAHGLRNDDAVRLQQAGSVPLAYEAVNPYAFEEPVSPHIAAAKAGVSIDLDRIATTFASVAREGEEVIVEGVGGWYVPLGDDVTVADMAQRLALPVVLVVGLRLGCLNHALLSARAIRGDGLTLAGWVANEVNPAMAACPENIAYLRDALEVPLVGVVPYREDAEPDAIAASLDIEMLL